MSGSGSRDTGAGIAPEHLDRVFEPFFTTKAVGKGTGLGLSQIFAFARQSGGDVAHRLELGYGTTVSIYLPRSAAAAERAAARPPAAVRRCRAAPRGRPGGAAILVVEDDPRVSRATVGALEELGHRPHPCAGGSEALEMLAREPRHRSGLTDVMMPEMTGTELAAEVEAPLAAHAPAVRHRLCRRGGRGRRPFGHELLRKPFTVNALAAAVAAALDGASLSGSRPAAASEEAA